MAFKTKATINEQILEMLFKNFFGNNTKEADSKMNKQREIIIDAVILEEEKKNQEEKKEAGKMWNYVKQAGSKTWEFIQKAARKVEEFTRRHTGAVTIACAATLASWGCSTLAAGLTMGELTVISIVALIWAIRKYLLGKEASFKDLVKDLLNASMWFVLLVTLAVSGLFWQFFIVWQLVEFVALTLFL